MTVLVPVPNQVPCDVGKIVYRGIYYGPLVLVMMILLVYYCTHLSATGGILDSQGMMVYNNTMERIFALENISVNPNLVIMMR